MDLPPIPPEYLDLPDEDLGLQIWAWWVTAQLGKSGISQGNLTPEIAENIRVLTLQFDTDTEAVAGLEKALKVIAQGDTARGGKIARQYVQNMANHIAALDEAKTGRRKQRVRARKARPNRLQIEVLKILTSNPEIDEQGVLKALRSLEGDGVIDTIDADEICFADGSRPVKLSNLRGTISRARKKIQSPKNT